MTFKRPVNVGDLIKFKSWVVHTWVAPEDPGQASRSSNNDTKPFKNLPGWRMPAHACAAGSAAEA